MNEHSSTPPTMTMEDLADRAGVSVRTIRYYVAEGLLPGASGRGRAASYSREHLLRLRLIRRLVERRLPLAEIRERLADLAPADVAALLREEDQRIEELRGAAEKSSPAAYVSALLRRAREARTPDEIAPVPPAAMMFPDLPLPSLNAGSPVQPVARQSWQRWELAPGVELHVRDDVRRRERKLIERLLRAAQAEPSR